MYHIRYFALEDWGGIGGIVPELRSENPGLRDPPRDSSLPSSVLLCDPAAILDIQLLALVTAELPASQAAFDMTSQASATNNMIRL